VQTQDLDKILNLMVSGQPIDASQACALLSGLPSGKQAELFRGAKIDSENGRLRLPMLSHISRPDSQAGMAELRLLLASSDAAAIKIRNSIHALCVNSEGKENTLVIGSKESESHEIFGQHFDSLAPLSAMPTLEELSIAKVAHLDLSGIEKISRLQKLKLDAIGKLSDWSSLEGVTTLRHLDINDVPCSEVHFTKAFCDLESLALNFYVPPFGVSSPWPSIKGLENLKNLKTLAIGGTIETLAGIEKLHKLEVVQFSMWSDFKDISPLIERLRGNKISFTLNRLEIFNKL